MAVKSFTIRSMFASEMAGPLKALLRSNAARYKDVEAVEKPQFTYPSGIMLA